MMMLLTALLAYLLGSIPFGIVMARLFGLGDLRQIGSGNIGATNVLRTGNKFAAFLTLLGDSGKGAAAVLLARALVGEQAAGIAGLCAMLGHLYPLFLRFRGGKGVATFLGTLIALSWPAGLLACATWLLVAVVTRYSSLSALVAALLAPIYTAVFYHLHGALLVLVLTALIFFKHRDNILRLKAGTETKIGQKG
ncbi:glycerol-3-phosphate 1-O-acyltransferase PlsY [Celeribacter indicus]|uniref:Glycerol-3-phosphate acyltransferase n=1 Tax=Celeribacter indicus TaxID=1208324 RepID=A0A0B5DZV9_9RHOB|nr:glycerol-3-phosphate 1-O-acyltransferase PlsY [Celeribacter indicus]AJE48998.1 acyl-phosphate glycerol-3-phosphate acyltransferase [Celeribacter indicus]SDW43313.1 acyl-phosphate glycerol-3-phosphate acyltransferase [Celeribacter indicus]